MSTINLNTNFSHRGLSAETTITFGMASMATLPGDVLEALALADIEASYPARDGFFWSVADLLRTEDEEEPRVVVLAGQIDRND